MSLYVRIKKRLGDFQLDVELETAGGVTGLLGASGCGKSVTLRCIAGVERPDEGRIVLDGQTLFDAQRGIDLPPQRRHVGVLFQSGALFPNMTVERNILCALRGERDRAARRRMLEEAVAMMRLEGLERRRPHELSGGQAQRAALARIFASRPRVLLLDEPFSALDAHLSEGIQMDMAALLRRFDREALLVTHSRDEAFRLCGRIAVMHAGRVVACRPARALFDDPGCVAAARITGCENITPARRGGDHLIEAPAWGVALRTAHPVGEGLCAVGIRADSFSAGQAENRFRASCAGTLEEPRARVARFRIEGQAADAPALLWRMPMRGGEAAFPGALGVAPGDVLPLYGEFCG